MNKPDLSVIVSAFNEADRIASDIAEIVATLRSFAAFEIIVVDDDSHDGPWANAMLAAVQTRDIRVIRNKTNRGKGSALAFGRRTVAANS